MDFTATVAPPFVVKPFTLHSFHGLMLASSRIGDPGSARAFARPYRDVPARVAAWLAEGRITRDAVPAIYLHEYTANGVTIRGLVGALELANTSLTCPDAQQAVFPHEGVLPAQVDELAERMFEMEINPAPILLVHRGPRSVRRLLHGLLLNAPDLSFTDRQEQVHRIWAIRDPEQLEELRSGLAETHALVADGHHRYAAYLRLQQEHSGTAWDRGLIMLVDQNDTPLWLGPIHRFVADVDLTVVARASSEVPGTRFELTTRPGALDHLGERVLALTDGRGWATITLDRSDMLPIAFLQQHLIPAWTNSPRVSFHHTAEEAMNRANRRPGVAVLMPSPGFDEVVRAAGAGELLPEKATSFQPKPSLGVLMRNLSAE